MPSGFEAYDPAVTPPLLREKYPRLRTDESRLLRAYLQETGLERIRQLRTAVPVGEGEVPGQPLNSRERQVKALSQWKIDAVVDTPGAQEVIEIKSRATHTAVGQAEAYDDALGLRDDEPTKSQPVVLAYRAHPDLPPYAEKKGVQLYLIPSADRTTATQRFDMDLARFRNRERG